MKTTFLFALIAAICLPQGLGAKTRKNKMPVDSVAQMISQHQWEVANDYLFHEGTAVVEGRLTGYTGEKPAGIVFNIHDLVLDKDDNQLLEVSADGSVNGIVRLPHSQFCFVAGITEEMYLGVGDTLRFVYDASQPQDNRLTFTGVSATACINRHWHPLKEHFYANKPMPYIAELSTADALYGFTAIYERMADSCMTLIARHKLPLDDVPHLARDILAYGLVNEAFVRILDAQMYYNDNRLVAIDNPETGQKEWKSNPDFVPLDSIRANRLFTRYEDMMLRTPLVLCSPQSWVVPNRMLFNQYLAQKQYQYTNPIWVGDIVPYPRAEEDSLMVVGQWERFYTLPRLYTHGVAQYISLITGRPGYSRNCYWHDATNQIQARTGLGESFMSQLGLCNKLARDVLNDRLGDSPDIVAGYMAETMPFITHSVLSRRIIEAYRRWVVAHETGTVTAKADRITDPTLLSLLEPYKGRLLFVDFWNTGCGPCRASMLGQRDMVARIKQSGIPASVLYVSNDENERRTNAEEWLAKNGIQGEHIFVSNDRWLKLRSVLNFSSIPFCIIVNADGTMHGNDGKSFTAYDFDELLKEKFPAYKSISE